MNHHRHFNIRSVVFCPHCGAQCYFLVSGDKANPHKAIEQVITCENAYCQKQFLVTLFATLLVIVPSVVRQDR